MGEPDPRVGGTGGNAPALSAPCRLGPARLLRDLWPEMEEPGNLEISVNPIIGFPKGAYRSAGAWTEFQYGVKGSWTTDFCLEGQKSWNDSAFFTGVRWENRFRLPAREHWIDPVRHVDFERVNGADKTIREIVGFGPEEGHFGPHAESRAERENEIETKLILSSNVKGWNFSEKFVAARKLSHEPWEFGGNRLPYAPKNGSHFWWDCARGRDLGFNSNRTSSADNSGTTT